MDKAKAVEQITAFCIQGRMKNGIKCIPASQSMRYKRGKIAFYENVYAMKQTKNAIKINKRIAIAVEEGVFGKF